MKSKTRKKTVRPDDEEFVPLPDEPRLTPKERKKAPEKIRHALAVVDFCEIDIPLAIIDGLNSAKSIFQERRNTNVRNLKTSARDKAARSWQDEAVKARTEILKSNKGKQFNSHALAKAVFDKYRIERPAYHNAEGELKPAEKVHPKTLAKFFSHKFGKTHPSNS